MHPASRLAGTTPFPPFPWLSLLALSACLVSHMFVQSSQFAYIGYMVQSLGVVEDKDQVGYYAGLLSSAFMVGRFASSYYWGKFADRHGRLPVLYVGLWSIVILSIAFGLSTTFWWALTCRLLLGALNGVAAVSKTLVSEVCGKEHEVVGMGVTTTAWSIALVIGPGLGGMLAEPAKYHPETFSESGILGRYPYLLPNIVGASFGLVALPLVFLFLRETKDLANGEDPANYDGRQLPARPSKTNRQYWLSSTKAISDSGLDGPNDSEVAVEGANAVLSLNDNGMKEETTQDNRAKGLFTSGSLLADPHVRAVLVMNGLYSVLCLVGTGILVFEMFVKPFFIKQLGVSRSQRWGSITSVVIYPSVPCLSLLSGSRIPLLATSLVVLFMAHVCANMIYINVALATNNAVSPSQRGELNGLAMTVCSLTKALAPFTCTAVFAWSIDSPHPFPLNHHLVYNLLALGMLAVTITGWDTINLEKRKRSPSYSESVSTDDATDIEGGQLSPMRAGELNGDGQRDTRGCEKLQRDERQGLVSCGERTDTPSYNTYMVG